MSYASLSTIAQLVCCPETPVNFARMVGDLDAVLSRFGDTQRQLTWDCEDVAIVDLPGTRILLGWSEQTGRGNACLSVGVGPSPRARVPGARDDGHDALCVRLVERVQPRLAPEAVVWHQVEGVVTAETIDALIEALPRLDNLATDLAEMAEAEVAVKPAEPQAAGPAPVAPEPPPAAPETAQAPAEKPVKSRRAPHLRRSAAQAASRTEMANDRPDLPRSRDPELARLRAALYEPQPAEVPEVPSSQMRLAVHAMNATLIVVYAPLGAAVMTYALLKGEDMKLSARLLMLTGSISMMVQTPLGQTMAAFVGT